MSMHRIIDKLYLGDYLCSINQQMLDRAGVTHVVTVLDQCRQSMKDLEYLLIKIPDDPTVDIAKYFPPALEFIHQARLAGKSVLVHCAQGVSRSVTIVVAYLMTISQLPWQRCLNAVQKVRPIANPNFGFRQQLNEYNRLIKGNSRPEKYLSQFKKYDKRNEDMDRLRRIIPPAAPTSTSKKTKNGVYCKPPFITKV